MTQLPSLNPIPADIEDHIRRLLNTPQNPATGKWLLELLRDSGHMSTGDDMRWRLLCMAWLALEYNPEEGWRYLQWMNMGEPAISGHLSEMLIEAADNLDAHVQFANWQAATTDPRLQTFFADFYPIPARRKMPSVIAGLLAQPNAPETGVWLACYCKGTAYHDGKFMRPWRLLTAAWLAAQFDAEAGLGYLKKLAGNAPTLSPVDNDLLMDAAAKTNGAAALIQMIADCANPAVKTMLAGFGHPNLPAVAESRLQRKPDYGHLSGRAEQVSADAATLRRMQEALRQAGVAPGAAVLNLACGPLAEQALLLGSAGYKITAVDLNIPPKFLPAAGAKLWLKRRKHHKAWQAATGPYFEMLAQSAGMKLKWANAVVKLADLTRLDAPDAAFDAVVCANHLHHAPNVTGLLAEAARILKPGGLFVANIRPFAGFAGALQFDVHAPWNHLRPGAEFTPPPAPFNKWRESPFRAAIEAHFTVTGWQPENDPAAAQLLTPQLRAELSGYPEEELTRTQIFVTAIKR